MVYVSKTQEDIFGCVIKRYNGVRQFIKECDTKRRKKDRSYEIEYGLQDMHKSNFHQNA